MKKLYSNIILSFMVVSLIILFINTPTVAVSYENEPSVLFTFIENTQAWAGYQGPVKQVTQPSADEKGSLMLQVSLMGRGWTDNTYESPEINKDFSKYSVISIDVYIKPDAPYDLKGQIFVKCGQDWTWRDNGWEILQRGKWITLTLPTTMIEHIDLVRTVGIKIGSNKKYDGIAYLDNVLIIPPSKAETKAQPNRNPSIKIVEILPNSRIKGAIYGLNPSQYNQYKVIIYVKTDVWYIHPYEKGGKDFSYANINQDGSWNIKTIKRGFLADYVAALIVLNSYHPPSKVDDLQQIEFIAIYKEDGAGRL